MMAAFLAKPGQGKTLGMVAVTLDDYLRGLDIQSNLKLRFPKVRGAGRVLPLDIEKLKDPDVELENLTLAIDELWLWMDSRRSGSKGNVSLSRLFMQSRKRDMNVLGTAQGFSQFDVRYRENVDMLFLCKKFNSAGQRVLDPLWSDPSGIVSLTPYSPQSETAISQPLRLNMGPLFPLYDHKQIFKVVEVAA